jgi:Kef-type K+ transport system membrane component KefB
MHVVLGAFAIGLLLAQCPLDLKSSLRPIKALTLAVSAPIFFSAAALYIDISSLLRLELILPCLAFCLIACVSKIFGCYFGGKLAGQDGRVSLAVGVGTNARGAMGLVFGIIGFNMGLLSQVMFTMVVFMSLFTTAICPLLLTRMLDSEDEATPLPQVNS